MGFGWFGFLFHCQDVGESIKVPNAVLMVAEVPRLAFWRRL